MARLVINLVPRWLRIGLLLVALWLHARAPEGRKPAKSWKHAVVPAFKEKGRRSAAAGVSYVEPNGFPLEKHPGGYATWLFTDLFLKDNTLVLISMVYVGQPRFWEDVRVTLLEAVGDVRFHTWHIRDAYESSVIGLFSDGALLAYDTVTADVTWGNETRRFTVRREASGRHSRFGACALFGPDRHLLGMWTSYWHLMGVDAFYLYYNGPARDIPALQRAVADLPPPVRVSFVHWPYDYWVPESNRPHSAQPMAVNDCFYRHRDAHDILMMYDLDELLVFPAHTSLASFYDSIAEPWAALRSQSAWARIDLAGVGAAYNTLTAADIAAAPLTRAPVHYSREKYAVNCSWPHTQMNVHGVYNVPTGVGTPGVPVGNGSEPQMLMHPAFAYHFHFVNVGRDRARDHLVTDPVVDARAQETVRANMARTGWGGLPRPAPGTSAGAAAQSAEPQPARADGGAQG